ncbi:hypothetical protein BH23ACT10_BH23ACT10_02240 [soil metagenome]
MASDDSDAWHVYQEAQTTWLTTPLPDGRTPMWAVDEEDTDAFMAAWEEADADAAAILREEIGARLPYPEAELRAECARLRAVLPAGAWPYDLLRAAGGVHADDLPDDDRDLWLTLASGVVTCRGEPPDTPDADTISLYAAWHALDHAAWVGAIATLARTGPGTNADADALAHYAATYNIGADDTDAWSEDWGDDLAPAHVDDWFADQSDLGPDLDDEAPLQVGFQTVSLLWQALGAVDGDGQLTALGWWGLPAAALRAWDPT